MKISIYQAGERVDAEVQCVPRVGEILTVVGHCRGFVEDVDHTLNPETGEHRIIIFLRT